jgi:hypothetical protein
MDGPDLHRGDVEVRDARGYQAEVGLLQRGDQAERALLLACQEQDGVMWGCPA